MTDNELNEAVARKLGWKFRRNDGIYKNYWQSPYEGDVLHDRVPNYCHSIEAAWEIVEKIKTSHRAIGVCAPMGIGTWTCEVYEKGKRIVGYGADTAPIAICKAFLKLP